MNITFLNYSNPQTYYPYPHTSILFQHQKPKSQTVQILKNSKQQQLTYMIIKSDQIHDHNKQTYMVSHIYWISGGVIFLTLLSLFFLSHLTLNQAQHLMQSSKFRFTCFLIQHFILICFMVAFVMKTGVYQLVKWGFTLSLLLCLPMTCTELIIHFLHYSNKVYSIRTVLPSQLAYLNCYFLIYMYSLIACILSGLFLLTTNTCIWYQSYKLQKCIKQSIKYVKYNSSIVDKQCSICITDLTDEEQLLEIKCGHIFHQSCLIQWIKRNQSCPTCRFKIFQALGQVENGLQLQIQVVENAQDEQQRDQ